MRDLKSRSLGIVWAIVLLLLSASVADAYDPYEDQRQSLGATMWVEYYGRDGQTYKVRGELIAVQDNTLFLLTGKELQEIPLQRIRKARMRIPGSNPGSVFLWTLLGSASTITHGLWLAVSLPAWLIVGTLSTAIAIRESQISGPRWDLYRKYARFPQGLPEGFDPHGLGGFQGSPPPDPQAPSEQHP